MQPMSELISVAGAQRLVLERVNPIEAERVPIERAAGRVLGEAALAAVDLPPFPSSAMDGFAVRSGDTASVPVTLPVAGRIAAGTPARGPLGPGQAMAIPPGGFVPDGADAVVPVELVQEDETGLHVREPVLPGANVRLRGGDASAGDTVLGAGTFLRPAPGGGPAAAGVSEVRCAKRPRVGILVTGSELC